MNGSILQGTSIAVDYWKICGVKTRFIHFLSHVHGDHIVGLTSTWTQPIYCSTLTAEILHNHYGISKSLLHHLPLNEAVLISLPNSQKTFTVTAFDANHCPGSVMFYFQGDFGNIFYTGDFRYSSETMSNFVLNLQGKIDMLYIDNTFCSRTCNFPSREICLSQIVEIVQQHPNHDIIIGVRKLGKEGLLVELGLTANETIYVSSERLQIIQLLYSTNIFSTLSLANGERCRIRTVPFHQVSTSLINNLNEKMPTIAILPSAIFTGLTCKPFSRNPNIYVIPFSDHCSYTELIEFVSQLQPAQVIPIVKTIRGPFGLDTSDRLDMTCFKPFLTPTRSINHSICHFGKGTGDDTTLELSDSLPDVDYDAGYSFSFSPPRENSQVKVFPSLKRKHSIPVHKRRKAAKGVSYIDDVPPQNDSVSVTQSNQISSSDGKEETDISMACACAPEHHSSYHTESVRNENIDKTFLNSKRILSSRDEDDKRKVPNVPSAKEGVCFPVIKISLSDKKNVIGDNCSSTKGMSMLDCTLSPKYNAEKGSPCINSRQSNTFTLKSKNLEYGEHVPHTFTSKLVSNLSVTDSITAAFNSKTFDVLHVLDTMKGKWKMRDGSSTNRSIISSLLSAIRKGESTK